MKAFIRITQVLLGLIFFVLGLNGFFLFLPVPDFHPFMEIMISSGFIYAEKVVEIVGGALLLTGRYTLLALLLLGPLVVNILLYHLMIDSRNWAIGVINLALYGILIFYYRGYFQVFLKKKP